VINAEKRRGSKPQRIDLTKASVSDFEAWLKDSESIKGAWCAPKAEKSTPVVQSSTRSPPDRTRRTNNNENRAKSHGENTSGGERKIKCWSGKEVTNVRSCWGS